MKIFDNITNIVRDDLKETIQRGSKVSIADACFSMYAYKELKHQLKQTKEFRSIFTSPTFIQKRLKSKGGNSMFQDLAGKPAYTAQNLKLSCATK